MPLGVAPMGLSGISRPGTDLALATAAGQAGIPFTLSNVSNDPMDQVVRAGNGHVFFQLYGISRDDAAYILDTFPIVREHDEKAFDRYLTKDLVLAYMNAVAAGDLTTMVKL